MAVKGLRSTNTFPYKKVVLLTLLRQPDIHHHRTTFFLRDKTYGIKLCRIVPVDNRKCRRCFCSPPQPAESKIQFHCGSEKVAHVVCQKQRKHARGGQIEGTLVDARYNVHTCADEQTHTRAPACSHTTKERRTHTHIYIYTHTHTNTHLYAHTHTHTHTHAHTHTRKHTHTHNTNTHTYTPVSYTHLRAHET